MQFESVLAQSLYLFAKITLLYLALFIILLLKLLMLLLPIAAVMTLAEIIGWKRTIALLVTIAILSEIIAQLT